MLKKLPFVPKDDKPQEGEEGESLTTVLETPEERSHLTLLVANITETMRKTITDAFDPSQTGQAGDQYANTEAQANFENANVQTADVELEDKKREEEEKRRKELSAPAMLDVKNAALKHFDDWRDSVIQRVGEVVNSRAEARSQKQQARPQSPEAGQAHLKLDPRPDKQDGEVNKVVRELYPPSETPLNELAREKKALILHSMLLLLLSLENYSAHSRVLLLYLTSSLDLPINLLAENESQTSRALLSAVEEMSAEEETAKKKQENSTARKWKVGLASVAGAALIGVTGGLAAPLLAAGIGSVMGGLGLAGTAAAGYLGTLAGSSVLVGGLFGAYGGRMTGQMMDKYAKEVEDFAFVPIRNFHRPRKIEKEYRRLRVAIGISGWLTEKDEVVKPWRVIAPSIEGFALRWELETLLNLGNSMTTMVRSAAWSVAKSEIIKRTVFGALMAGLWPLGLLKAGRLIDNPFSVAKARSEKAGEVLADAIINKAQGERPLTLIGYSLGARVIYSCLTTLAERKAFGLVESVVFIGAPMPSTAADWRKIRAVVSGRVVNVYSTQDYILAFLYRTSSIQYGIAGLQEVRGVKGVQNVDVSDIVSGHTMYRYLAGTILSKIGFEDISPEDVRLEKEELEAVEQKDEEDRQRNEDSRQAKQGGEDADDEEVKGMEREVEQKNKATTMAWASEKLSSGRSAVGNAWSGVTGRSGSQAPKGPAEQKDVYEGT